MKHKESERWKGRVFCKWFISPETQIPIRRVKGGIPAGPCIIGPTEEKVKADSAESHKYPVQTVGFGTFWIV